MKRATIKDVARLAGVSVTTVSQILNKKKEFSPETVEKVLKTVRESGYIANRNAKQLRGPKRRLIGVIVPDLSNPFFGALLQNLKNTFSNLETADEKYDVLFQTPAKSGLATSISELVTRGIDGLILTTQISDYDRLNTGLTQLNIPYVLLDRAVKTNDFHSITVDEYQGGKIAADHLVNQGHDHIAVLTTSETIENLAWRQAGFLKTWENNKKPSPQIIHVSLDKIGGMAAVEQLDANITAIFAINDEIAIGALRGLHEQNKKIAVIGYDGIADGAYLIPSLTTVAQPQLELAKLAVETLLAQFNNVTDYPAVTPLTPSLIIRESTIK